MARKYHPLSCAIIDGAAVAIDNRWAWLSVSAQRPGGLAIIGEECGRMSDKPSIAGPIDRAFGWEVRHAFKAHVGRA